MMIRIFGAKVVKNVIVWSFESGNEKIFQKKASTVRKIIHTFAAKYEKSYQSYKTIIMEAEKGKYIFGVVKVGDRGQVVIPKEAREVYGIKAGDSLLVLGDSRGMAILKTEIFQDKIDEMFGEG